MINVDKKLKAISMFDDLTGDFTELCKPIRCFGIDHVSLIKTYYNGKIINLSTIPGWVEEYYHDGLYLSSDFEDHPSNYESFIFTHIDNAKPVIKIGKEKFNSHQCITVSLKRHNRCEFYFFSTDNDRLNLASIFLHYKEFIYRFIYYLNGKTKYLQDSLSVYKQDIYDKEYVATSLVKPSLSLGVKAFEKAINSEGGVPFVRLTPREEDCLGLILNGLSTDKIKKTLSVGRAYHDYVVNLRSKFRCESVPVLLAKIYNEYPEYAEYLRDKAKSGYLI